MKQTTVEQIEPSRLIHPELIKAVVPMFGWTAYYISEFGEESVQDRTYQMAWHQASRRGAIGKSRKGDSPNDLIWIEAPTPLEAAEKFFKNPACNDQSSVVAP